MIKTTIAAAAIALAMGSTAHSEEGVTFFTGHVVQTPGNGGAGCFHAALVEYPSLAFATPSPVTNQQQESWQNEIYAAWVGGKEVKVYASSVLQGCKGNNTTLMIQGIGTPADQLP